MNRTKATIFFSILMATGFTLLFFSSCRRKLKEGIIIFTQVYVNEKDKNVTGAAWQYTTPTRIFALDPEGPDGSPEMLTEDYYSARSPQVSYDGGHMIFTAQKKQNDAWQIYEMDLKDSKIRQITTSMENCIDPAYLPGGRLVFSKLIKSDTLKTGYSLFTCSQDGTDLKQITFNPYATLFPTILKDGRILTVSRQLNADKSDQVFMVLRPDGTKDELFYKSPEGNKLSGHGWETMNGKIVFIESDNTNNERGNIIFITYNRPLHSRTSLTSEIEGDFKTVFPEQSGRLLVSYRKPGNERYAIYYFDPENKVIGNSIYSNKEYDILEVVAAEKHERPKKLPSEVDMGVKTGLLLCQNINYLDKRSSGSSSALPKAYKIQVIGRDSTLGEVKVERDGSFYLKVIADTPFRIQTLDEKGRVINGPCDWIWLRPNERRGCIGCHEDPQMVPANIVPLSVKKSPVNIPVHINKVVEKKVSLE